MEIPVTDPQPPETGAPDRRLRISHVEIRPVLVWDDGLELAPGPPLNPASVPLSHVKAMLDGLPAEVELLAKQIAEQQAER